jgi:hypothetical protein
VSGKYFSELKKEAVIQRLRGIFAAVLSVTLATVPLIGAPTATVSGTAVTAERAHVGDGIASIGTTVFGEDRLSTEDRGSVQIRAEAARLLLLSASTAMVNDSEGAPSAELLIGTATFSTGNAHGLHAVRLESSDSRAIEYPDDWAGKDC